MIVVQDQLMHPMFNSFGTDVYDSLFNSYFDYTLNMTDYTWVYNRPDFSDLFCDCDAVSSNEQAKAT